MFDDSLDRSLCKNGINLVIKDRTHKAGIDVEILNILDFDSIVFVWIKKKSTSKDIGVSVFIFFVVFVEGFFWVGIIGTS